MLQIIFQIQLCRGTVPEAILALQFIPARLLKLATWRRPFALSLLNKPSENIPHRYILSENIVACIVFVKTQSLANLPLLQQLY